MNEAHHVDFQSTQFQVVGFLIPFVASAGSLISGYVSDTIFQGRRAPVAAGLYFLETAIIFLAAQFHTPNAAAVFLVLISFTANATNSILGTSAAMDAERRHEIKIAAPAFIEEKPEKIAGQAAAKILEGIDHAAGKARHFRASDVPSADCSCSPFSGESPWRSRPPEHPRTRAESAVR